MKKYKVTISTGDGMEYSKELYLTLEQFTTITMLQVYFNYDEKNYNELYITINEIEEEQ